MSEDFFGISLIDLVLFHSYLTFSIALKMKGGRIPSVDKNKVNWGSNKHKNPKKKDTADEVKRIGQVKKKNAGTTTNEVKQNTGKKKKCKATTTAYEDNLILSKQVDGSNFFYVHGSNSSNDSCNLSFHNDLDNISGDESDKTSQSDGQVWVLICCLYFHLKKQ